jgi:hypothetical protein
MLGLKEFKINFQRIKEGLSRSREAARLQEEIDKDSEELKKRW